MAKLRPGLRSGHRSVGEFGKDLFRLFLPPLCAVCESPLASREAWICRSCMTDLAAGAGVKEREVEMGGGGTLTVLYPLEYTPAVARLIKQMKYSDRPGLARLLAPFLAFVLSARSFGRPVLVPVPLHAAKRRERGYNQSELLSYGVSRLTAIDVAGRAAVRIRNTSAQAGLDGEDRLTNMKGAFAAAQAGSLAGRHVILIDDVVTTGATLRECAGALAGSGVREVTACVVASSA